jgi:hypothetical protein
MENRRKEYYSKINGRPWNEVTNGEYVYVKVPTHFPWGKRLRYKQIIKDHGGEYSKHASAYTLKMGVVKKLELTSWLVFD